MAATAEAELWPGENSGIVVRAVFLYAGQGDSTLVLVRDGTSYQSLLVDINLDQERGGIDVPTMLADLLPEKRLDVFVNTHPHADHLRGIEELRDAVDIGAVWHSGHVPSKKHCPMHEDLTDLIEECGGDGSEAVVELAGSRTADTIGDAMCHVLAPADYVRESVNEQDAERRRALIHENCAVLKFGVADTWLMLPGDADKDAFQKYIADYDRERLAAAVLSAPHHGSGSFFFSGDSDDEEPYLDALEKIAPSYVVVSAPTRNESPHDHPCQRAMEEYADAVGSADNVLHTGANRYSFICDIYDDGQFRITDDAGVLSDGYPVGGKEGGKSGAGYTISGTRTDDRPMGAAL